MTRAFIRTAILAGLMSAFTHAVILAQTEDALAPDEENGVRTFAGIDTISVYATRNPTSSFDYAGQVTVIERDLILDFSLSSFGDVFDAIPGAQFDSGPRRTGDTATVRGMSGGGVLMFLDGARQSFLSGHDGRFFIDPELIKSIEVVRGPTSSLYGSGALGGVIATRTVTAEDLLDADEAFAVRLNTGFQSVDNDARVGATAAWRSADGKINTVGHLTYRESGNIRLGNGLSLPADDEILSSLLKLGFNPVDGLSLYGSWVRFGSDSTDPQNPQGNNLPEPGNELVFRDIRSDTFQTGLNWNPDSALIDLKIAAYQTENIVGKDETHSPRTTSRSVKTTGISFDNRSGFILGDEASLEFTYGGEFYRDRQKGRDNENPDGSRGGVPDARTDFYGVFIQAELAVDAPGPIPGTLSVIPGIRWDSYKSSTLDVDFNVNDDRLSPKVGMTYKPVHQFMIFGNYSKGFRAPSFNEAFADGTHFSIPDLSRPTGPRGPVFVSNLFVGNQDLASESSRSWEAGAGFDFGDIFASGDAFLIKGSYYRSRVNNLIGIDVSMPLGCVVPALASLQPCGTGAEFNNVSRYVNITNALIDGVEISATYDSDHVYLHGNASQINGVDRMTGEFLEGVLTPVTIFLDGGIKYQPWGLRAGSRVTHAGTFNKVNDPEEKRSGFTVADIYMIWEPKIPAFHGMRMDLGIDNIMDKNYERINRGVSQPGRSFKIALSWRLGFAAP